MIGVPASASYSKAPILGWIAAPEPITLVFASAGPTCGLTSGTIRYVAHFSDDTVVARRRACCIDMRIARPKHPRIARLRSSVSASRAAALTVKWETLVFHVSSLRFVDKGYSERFTSPDVDLMGRHNREDDERDLRLVYLKLSEQPHRKMERRPSQCRGSVFPACSR